MVPAFFWFRRVFAIEAFIKIVATIFLVRSAGCRRSEKQL